MRLHCSLIFVLFMTGWQPGWLGAQSQECHQLETVLSHFIDSRVHADSMAVTYRWPAALPSGPYDEVIVDWTRSDKKLCGQVVLPVRIKGRGMGERVQYVRAQIRTFDNVVTARRNIGRYDMLAAAYLGMAFRETTSLRGGFYRQVSAVEGFRVKRLITADRIVLSNMIETPPLVRRGSTVEVAFAHGNLMVTTTGVARQDGWAGDIVRIRMPNDRKELKGRVAGSGQVKLTF